MKVEGDGCRHEGGRGQKWERICGRPLWTAPKDNRERPSLEGQSSCSLLRKKVNIISRQNSVIPAIVIHTIYARKTT